MSNEDGSFCSRNDCGSAIVIEMYDLTEVTHLLFPL